MKNKYRNLSAFLLSLCMITNFSAGSGITAFSATETKTTESITNGKLSYPASGLFSATVSVTSDFSIITDNRLDCVLYRLNPEGGFDEVERWDTFEYPEKALDNLRYSFKNENDRTVYRVVIENLYDRQEGCKAYRDIIFTPQQLSDGITEVDGNIALENAVMRYELTDTVILHTTTIENEWPLPIGTVPDDEYTTTSVTSTEPSVSGVTVPEHVITTAPPLEKPLSISYPAKGKFTAEIWIADNHTGFVIFGADCTLYEKKNGEYVRKIASWNTADEPGKVFSDLDYFFEKEDDTVEYEVVIDNLLSKSENKPAAGTIEYNPYFLMDDIHDARGVVLLPLPDYELDNGNRNPFSPDNDSALVTSVPAESETSVTTATSLLTVTSNTPETTYNDSSDYIYFGDIDGNGSVTSSDLVLLTQYLLSSDKKLDHKRADLNSDGAVNILDLIIIKQLLLD